MISMRVPSYITNLGQIGASQNPKMHLPIAEHAKAHRILPHAHETTCAIDRIEYPVLPCRPALGASEVCGGGGDMRVRGYDTSTIRESPSVY